MITKAEIEKYFIAEKQAGLLFLYIGIIGIVLALIGFFILKTNTWKGIAIPFAVIGIIQAAAGYTVYNRSDEQRKDNVYALDMNPDKLLNVEIPRMEKVNKNFHLFLFTEVLLLVTGISLASIFRNNPEKQILYGVGVALIIQCLITLGADFLAERRAKTYTAGLKTLQRP